MYQQAPESGVGMHSCTSSLLGVLFPRLPPHMWWLLDSCSLWSGGTQRSGTCQRASSSCIRRTSHFHLPFWLPKREYCCFLHLPLLPVGSTAFMCYCNSSALPVWTRLMTSSTYLFQLLGWQSSSAMAMIFCSKFAMYKFITMGDTGLPRATPNFCS